MTDFTDFTPEAMEDFAMTIYATRADMLCTDERGAEPQALHHFMLALSCMEQAVHHFKLARLLQSRDLAGGRR